MANYRTIKRETFDDEKLASFPYGCRWLYVGLWLFADDAGVLKSSAKFIKAKVFPYDDSLRISEIDKWLKSLEDARMLIPFTYADEGYYMIRSFSKHQKIDKRYEKRIITEDDLKLALGATRENPAGTLGNPTADKIRLDKIREDEDKIGKEGEIDTVISVCGAGSKTPPLDPKDKQTTCHPSPDEVAEYFKSKGYKAEAGYKAHEYYATNDWKDSKNNPVKNWKQKMIAVWFKPENVETKPQSYTPTENDNWI